MQKVVPYTRALIKAPFERLDCFFMEFEAKYVENCTERSSKLRVNDEQYAMEMAKVGETNKSVLPWSVSQCAPV